MYKVNMFNLVIIPQRKITRLFFIISMCFVILYPILYYHKDVYEGITVGLMLFGMYNVFPVLGWISEFLTVLEAVNLIRNYIDINPLRALKGKYFDQNYIYHDKEWFVCAERTIVILNSNMLSGKYEKKKRKIRNGKYDIEFKLFLKNGETHIIYFAEEERIVLKQLIKWIEDCKA